MKVFIWWKGGEIASVTLKYPLVKAKLKRDGMNPEDCIEVWENEKKIDTYFTADEFINSFKQVTDDDEENNTFW